MPLHVPEDHARKLCRVKDDDHWRRLKADGFIRIHTINGAPMVEYLKVQHGLRAEAVYAIERYKREVKPSGPPTSPNASAFPSAAQLCGTLCYTIAPTVIEELAREGAFRYQVEPLSGAVRIDKLSFRQWFDHHENQRLARQRSQNQAASSAVEKRQADEAAQAKADQRANALADARQREDARCEAGRAAVEQRREKQTAARRLRERTL
jgi:hypothetical protein